MPCRITEFKIRIEGSINSEFEVIGRRLPSEVLSEFYKLKNGDVLTFYDIVGITNKYESQVNFKPSRLVIKSCDW